MNKLPAMAALKLRSDALNPRAWLINAMHIGLLGALLSGCTQSLPERPDKEAPEAEATETAAAAEAEADKPADEPLPWPPANGDIPQPQEAAAVGKMFEWRGGGRRVSRIVIDTDTQQARFFAGEDLVGWSNVATGVSSHRTPTGEFSILEKVSDKRSNLYGRIYDSEGKLVKRNAKAGRDAVPAGGRFVGARMPHFLRMTYDGVGMHAGPIPRPGSPASHGCIRMPAQLADALFDHVDEGARVTVIGSQGPSYGNYAERVKARQGEARARRAAAKASQEGEPLDGLDAEIAALRGEEFPPKASSSGSEPEGGDSPAARPSATETDSASDANASGDANASSSDATVSGDANASSDASASGAAEQSGSGSDASASPASQAAGSVKPPMPAT
ncbi:L,D-transpeptidase [Thiorhodovibrio frisius]|nr:L,D-transpeptidase [Thiorhodovibrio frisius]